MDKITLLRAMPGVLFAKRWTVDGIKGYDKARYVYVKEEEVSCIHTLASVLRKHEKTPDVCSIRGMKISLDDAKALGTLPDLAGGEPLPAVKMSGRSYAYLRRKGIFNDAAHHWVCLDGDTFRPVKTAGDLLTKPENCVAEFLLTLPEPFQTATCYWQLSNSHGAVGNEGLLKVHLWFWMAKARTGAELLAYAEATGMDKLVDITLFRTVQVHYIAAPVIDDGVVCPVVERSGLLPGLMGDEVELDVTSEMLVRVRPERDGLSGGLWDDGDAPVDPASKGGLVGAFCRAFGTLADVMSQDWAEDLGFTPDDGSDRRWTWGGGGGAAGGAWVADGPAGGQWVGNSHATDPCAGRLVNMYDLVRMHRFGDLDSAVSVEDQWTLEADVRSRPSEAAMRAWCRTLPEVRAELEAAEVEAERLADEAAVAGGDVDSNDTLGGGDGDAQDKRDAKRAAKLGRDLVKAMQAKMFGLGVAESERESLVDWHVLRRMWDGGFFNAERSRFFLLNKVGEMIMHVEPEWQRAMGEAYGHLINEEQFALVAARISGEANETDEKKQTERKDIMRKGIWSVLKAYVKDYRQRGGASLIVDPFTDKSSIQVTERDALVVYPMVKFAMPKPGVSDEDYAAVVEEYRVHFPYFDEFIDSVLHARFANSRRQAFLWLRCGSSWGKDLLMEGVLGKEGLNIVANLSLRDLEAASEGKPVGFTVDHLVGKWILFVNEMHTVKREIKELNKEITANPKNQLRFTAELFLKVFASAEHVEALVSDNGVENQFSERFNTYDLDTGRIDDRPVFKRVLASTYKAVLRHYAAERLNLGIERMQALGRVGAYDAGDVWLRQWHEERGIGLRYGTLDESIPEMVEDLRRLILKQAAVKAGAIDDSWNPINLGKLPRDLAEKLDNNVSIALGSRHFAEVGSPRRIVVVRNPTTLVHAWLKATVSHSALAMMAKKASKIADLLSWEPVRKPPRFYQTDDEGKVETVKAVQALFFYDGPEPVKTEGKVLPFVR